MHSLSAFNSSFLHSGTASTAVQYSRRAVIFPPCIVKKPMARKDTSCPFTIVSLIIISLFHSISEPLPPFSGIGFIYSYKFIKGKDFLRIGPCNFCSITEQLSYILKTQLMYCIPVSMYDALHTMLLLSSLS